VLDPAQTALSRAIMAVDPQIVADGTYFVVLDELSGRLAGGGGWSRRGVYRAGGHSTPERDAAMAAMPADAARIRAMYVHPDFARRGLGRMILSLCEQAARDAGFVRVELMATLAGEPLYRACGYEEISRFAAAERDGIRVPGVRMGKRIA
jgi:GNAT superfamily N-acetyltransferase